MNAEILDSTSSGTAGEVSYKVPIPSSSPPRRRGRIPIALYSLGLLLLLATIAIGFVSLHSHASPSSKPLTAAAPTETERWNSLGILDIEGGVTPLNPLQMGQVKEIKVKENEPVKRGDELLRLDDSVQALKVRQAAAALHAAQDQLAVAEGRVKEASEQIVAQQKAIEAAKLKVDQASLGLEQQKRLGSETLADSEAVKNAEILLKLANVGVEVEQRKLASYQAAKRTAEGLVAVAKDNVEAKKALLDEARDALDKCVLRAPVDGTPLRINVTVGETFGVNPRQQAIVFAANRPLLVRAEVEQEFVDHVKQGKPVIIEDSVTEKEIARGKVGRIARWYAPRRSLNAELLPTNGDNRTVECIIHIDSPSPTLRIGQRVRVKFPD